MSLLPYPLPNSPEEAWESFVARAVARSLTYAYLFQVAQAFPASPEAAAVAASKRQRKSREEAAKLGLPVKRAGAEARLRKIIQARLAGLRPPPGRGEYRCEDDALVAAEKKKRRA